MGVGSEPRLARKYDSLFGTTRRTTRKEKKTAREELSAALLTPWVYANNYPLHFLSTLHASLRRSRGFLALATAGHAGTLPRTFGFPPGSLPRALGVPCRASWLIIKIFESHPAESGPWKPQINVQYTLCCCICYTSPAKALPYMFRQPRCNNSRPSNVSLGGSHERYFCARVFCAIVRPRILGTRNTISIIVVELVPLRGDRR